MSDSPERAMWRAVISQAVIDASWTRTGKHENPDDSRLNRDQARAWLLGNSRDFRHVCYLADLDPDAVRDSALRKDEAGWPSMRNKMAA